MIVASYRAVCNDSAAQPPGYSRMNQHRLPPGQQLTAAGKWPIVGEKQPAPMVTPWALTVSGLVAHSRLWSLEQLLELPSAERRIDIHCVTRWSKFDMLFGGVRLADVLAATEPSAEAKFLSFVAHSERRHSTSLPLAEAIQLDAMLALSAAGQPLGIEHGGPLRLVVPGKYFYKSLKWLTEIRVLAQDELGFWEGKAGYHNEADPWREQRYVAPNLNRMQVAKAFTQRNFAGLEFQSLEARGIALPGLDATGAILRNADFRDARLTEANFTAANLSNAHFHGADLRKASFRSADVEGADFSAADLRGCDFRGASLLGTTFVAPTKTTAAAPGSPPAQQAMLDRTTRLDPEQLSQLSPLQADFLTACIG